MQAPSGDLGEQVYQLAALISVLAIAAAWLLSPILHAQYVEGYAANLHSIALAMDRGDFVQGDPMYPVVTEFHYYTRPLVVGILRLTSGLFADGGDWPFRILIWLSFATLVAGSIAIARRWSGVPAWAAFSALLLVPGVSEVAFHLNDNLPAAALAVASLWLIVIRDRASFYFLAGALMAAAILCRLDSVLFAPALLGQALLRHKEVRALGIRAGAALAGSLLILAIGALVLRATPVDALLIAREFIPPQAALTTAIMTILFFGAPGALLLPIGLVSCFRKDILAGDRLRRAFLFYAVPAVILLAAFRLATETRYIYPLLTPFIALFGGWGLQVLATAMRGRFRVAGLAGLAALALFTLVPPVAVAVRDGPRSPVGRLWMPILWWQWEDAMQTSLDKADDLVRIAEQGRPLLLVGTHFNEDFFVKQRFLAAGYRMAPARSVFPGCDGFIAYQKQGRLVVHLRTERQYALAPTSKSRLRAMLIDSSLGCKPLRSIGHAYLLVWGDDKRVTDFSDTIDPAIFRPIVSRLAPASALSVSLAPRSLFKWPFWQSDPAGDGVPRHQLQGVMHIYRLSQAELHGIAASARAYSAAPVVADAWGDRRPASYGEFQAAYAPRCADPTGSAWNDLPLCLR